MRPSLGNTYKVNPCSPLLVPLSRRAGRRFQLYHKQRFHLWLVRVSNKERWRTECVH